MCCLHFLIITYFDDIVIYVLYSFFYTVKIYDTV